MIQIVATLGSLSCHSGCHAGIRVGGCGIPRYIYIHRHQHTDRTGISLGHTNTWMRSGFYVRRSALDTRDFCWQCHCQNVGFEIENKGPIVAADGGVCSSLFVILLPLNNCRQCASVIKCPSAFMYVYMYGGIITIYRWYWLTSEQQHNGPSALKCKCERLKVGSKKRRWLKIYDYFSMRAKTCLFFSALGFPYFFGVSIYAP